MTTGRDFAVIFDRELTRLAAELAAYRDEADLWRAVGAQPNPPGSLALHVVGFLRHYVGAALGGTGYVRDRSAEFELRDLQLGEVLDRIEACRAEIVPVLERLDAVALDTPYPGTPPERLRGARTGAFLIHLTWHVGWHLGQVRYHRLAGG